MSLEKIASSVTEAYAFGVSAALRDLGMEKEAAIDLAVKEAAAAAPGLLKRIGGAAKSTFGKAKETARDVAGKMKAHTQQRPFTPLPAAGVGLAAGGVAGGLAAASAKDKKEK